MNKSPGTEICEQTQSARAQSHRMAYQNKTSSFAICQGQPGSGLHLKTQKTATVKAEHTPGAYKCPHRAASKEARVQAPLNESGHSSGARRAGVSRRRRAGFQTIWIEFNSGICNNCMSLSCHGKPRQLCWRPLQLMASAHPSQAEEVKSQGRTQGPTLLPVTPGAEQSAVELIR